MQSHALQSASMLMHQGTGGTSNHELEPDVLLSAALTSCVSTSLQQILATAAREARFRCDLPSVHAMRWWRRTGSPSSAARTAVTLALSCMDPLYIYSTYSGRGLDLK